MKATDGYTIKTLESVTSSDKPGVQIVYKVLGDVNGFISGDNITVILMGDGNVNGDVKIDHGEVVLIKGNINGDVNAETLVCPEKPEVEGRKNPAKNVKSPELPVKKTSSPQVVHYERVSCESCQFYHPTDDKYYKMYCEKTKSFYASLKPCSFNYKRRD